MKGLINCNTFFVFQKNNPSIFIININNTKSLIKFTYQLHIRKIRPQILTLKDEYAFRFSNFLIVELCNSSSYSWFGIVLFSIADLSWVSRIAVISDEPCVAAPSEDFLSKKNCKPLKQDPFDNRHIGF